MIINSFPKIVKGILRGLPKNDYPVLNSRLFFECWLWEHVNFARTDELLKSGRINENRGRNQFLLNNE
ncbi:MAG: hypothetical protein V7K49_15885, partial [Nostoc sp.]